MSETVKAFALLVGLVIVTFCSGYLPNCCTNKRLLNLLAVFGGGILMGAALLVVLPESVGIMVAVNYSELSGPVTADQIFPTKIAVTIGLSITLGFVFMLLLDEVVSCCQKSQANRHKKQDLDFLSEREGLISGDVKENIIKQKQSSVMVTTAGLCFHSLAEGVAMGAS